MKVLVRVQQSTVKQRKYFGDNAWRPFVLLKDVYTEEDVLNKLKKVMNRERVKGAIKFMRVDSLETDIFQYGVLDGRRVYHWVPL